MNHPLKKFCIAIVIVIYLENFSKANSLKIENQNNLNSFILASYHRGFNQAMSFWQPLIEGNPYLGSKNMFAKSTSLDGLLANTVQLRFLTYIFC
jgi:hypothetical protein